MDETVNAESSSSQQNTAPTENVRVKISSWLSGIVDEVKKKAPTPLQPWADTSPGSAESSETTTKSLPIISIVNDNESSLENPQKSEDNQSNDNETNVPEAAGNTGSSGSSWLKTNFLNKFNKDRRDRDESRTVSNLTNIGKAKINEFYDKVRINKARYYILKNRKMEVVRMSNENINGSLNDINEKKPNEEGFPTSTPNDSKTSIDENLNTSDTSNSSDVFLNVSRKLTIGEIGRSSTTETNPPSLKAPSLSATKNISIGNIGRSFSEQNDDDFVLNERSRSYTQVGNNRKKNPNPDNVSCSLPSFFGNKSLSISPIAKQGCLSRETSLSESPRKSFLLRDGSVQSDSSHCSSVDSLLESRKPDPEQILVNLGFGPVEPDDVLVRIPKRFLKPSQVKGIDTEAFIRQQQMANQLHDHSVLGYRGLLGDPDLPPSMIVAKIMERFEMNDRNKCIFDINMNRPQSAPPTPGPNA